MDKTRRLRTSPWALGNTDPHFSPFSDILWTKQIIIRLIDNENKHKMIISFILEVNHPSQSATHQLPFWSVIFFSCQSCRCGRCMLSFSQHLFAYFVPQRFHFPTTYRSSSTVVLFSRGLKHPRVLECIRDKF